MASSDLSFNITALDKAGATFVKLSEQIDRFSARLDELDRKDVNVKVDVDTRDGEAAAEEFGSKVNLILAGIAVAAPVAGAAIVAGVGAGFIGLAAIAEHNNTQIQGSFQELANDVSDSMEGLAVSTVPELAAAGDRLRGTFDSLKPALREAFENVTPYIGILTGGIDQLAHNTMPGLVAITHDQSAAFDGLAIMLGQTGHALSDTFTGLSQHSRDFGIAFQTTGSLVDSTMGVVTTLLTSLTGLFVANSGTIVASFQRVDQVVRNLATGAMPFLGGGIHAVLDVATGLLTVLGSLGTGLGTVAGIATDAALAFKSWQGVTGFVASAATAIDSVAEKVGNVSTGAGVAMLNVGKFASAMAGPLGIAIGIVTVGLGILGQAQQDQAKNAQLNTQRTQELADALRKSGGAIDDNVRASAAKALADFKVSDGQRNLLADVRQLVGPSMLPALTNAYLGNTTAQGNLVDSLRQVQAANTEQVRYADGTVIPTMNKTGLQAKQTADIIGGMGDKTKDARNAEADLAAATQATHSPMVALQSDMAVMRDTTSSADDKVKALNDALKILSGNALSAAQADDAFQKAVSALSREADHGRVVLDGNSQAALNNRASVFSAMDALQKDTTATYQSALQNHNQTDSLNIARDALIRGEIELRNNMLATYGNRDSVDALLSRLGLMPSQAAAAMGGIRGMADGMTADLNRIPNRNVNVTAQGNWMETTTAWYSAPKSIGETGRASGGPIYGPGTETSDDIPAWLSHNEYVMQASAHRKYGTGFMDALNQGSLDLGAWPGFAGGGSLSVQTGDLNASAGALGPFMPWENVKIDDWARRIAEQMRKMMSGAGGNWGPLVAQVLAMLGQSQALIPSVLRRIQQESGGNPAAINLWDSNAAAGHPSIGLMQTIGPTFDAYAGPFRGLGIYNPLANVYAGLNYALHAYGSLQYAMDKPGGYADGGVVTSPQMAMVGEDGAEAIVPLTKPDRARAVARQAGLGGDHHYHLTVYNAGNDAIDLRAQFKRLEIASGIL